MPPRDLVLKLAIAALCQHPMLSRRGSFCLWFQRRGRSPSRTSRDDARRVGAANSDTLNWPVGEQALPDSLPSPPSPDSILTDHRLFSSHDTTSLLRIPHFAPTALHHAPLISSAADIVRCSVSPHRVSLSLACPHLYRRPSLDHHSFRLVR